MNGDESQSKGNFPFHEYCSFCKDECQHIDSESEYILITNIWNERENIERTFRWISNQTKQPKVWLWIDDGSTDDSRAEIERLSETLPNIEVWIKAMPEKTIGSLDEIGIAYDTIIPPLRETIDKTQIDYLTIMDVDTEPCPNYYSRIMSLMDKDPKIGAAVGIPIGEVGRRRVDLPMGSAKVIRWKIVREIDRYWDIAPDTLLNIKALVKGYKLRIWKLPIRLEEPTQGFSPRGVYRLGRLNYYVGRPFWAVFFRALRRFFLRQHGTQMLRGYFHERRKGTWRFDDPDVKWFYNRGTNPISALLEILRFVSN